MGASERVPRRNQRIMANGKNVVNMTFGTPRNWNLMLDLKIIFLTVVNAIKGEKNAF